MKKILIISIAYILFLQAQCFAQPREDEHYNSGRLKVEWSILEGGRTLKTEYLESGLILQKQTFSNGQLIQKDIYDESGQFLQRIQFSSSKEPAETAQSAVPSKSPQFSTKQVYGELNALRQNQEKKARMSPFHTILLVLLLIFLGFIIKFAHKIYNKPSGYKDKIDRSILTETFEKKTYQSPPADTTFDYVKEVKETEEKFFAQPKDTAPTLETKMDIHAPQKELNMADPENQMMFRKIVETVKSGIFITDPNGRLLYVNNSLAQILGFNTKQDIMDLNINKEFSDVENPNEGFLYKMQKTKGLTEYTFKYEKKYGANVLLSVNANYVYDEKGDIIGIQGVVQDITEKKDLEKAVLNEKRKLEFILELFENIDSIRELNKLIDFIVKGIIDILEANKCSIMLVDEKRMELKIQGALGLDENIIQSTAVKVGEPIVGIVALERRPVLVKNIEYDEKFRKYQKPSYLGRSFLIVPLIYEGNLLGVINVTDKKTELKGLEAFNELDLRILTTIAGKVAGSISNVKLYGDLNLLTVTDPITNIHNYRQFSDSLDQEIKRFKREKKDLCIFMMDLDDFKSYNDTYGHVEGDDLLRNLGEILKSNLRETDIVCRYAGDEFCVVLPETNIDGVQNAAQKIIKAVSSFPFKRKVTISIGAAQYSQGLSKQDFIKKADQALYEAKQAGKNRVMVTS